MKINELKPGKELDALVAEKVMGCKLSDDGVLYVSDTDVLVVNMWSPSTDITDAWRVVEKLQELPPVFRGDSYEWFAIDAPIRNEENSDRWLVGWKYHYAYEGDEWYCQEDGLTVMEAICKAALARMLDERI